mmetsp:Transcript_46687/g.123334  ORF Transcript_46687/g.123334 Transcript_46687/m.123334 type:complete len:82 (+) Transcript_46687:304-549(+)
MRGTGRAVLGLCSGEAVPPKPSMTPAPEQPLAPASVHAPPLLRGNPLDVNALLTGEGERAAPVVVLLPKETRALKVVGGRH